MARVSGYKEKGLYQKPEIPVTELSAYFSFNHSQTNYIFRMTTELSLSGIQLFLRGQGKALADKGRECEKSFGIPTWTHGYPCHLFLPSKKLGIINEC